LALAEARGALLEIRYRLARQVELRGPRVEVLGPRLEIAPPGFDRSEQAVERAFGVGDGALRFAEHVRRHAEAPRDRQAVGAARHTLQQAIGRREGLRIELQ